MAKVIRNQWVYRPHNHWFRYLPRRVDGMREYQPDQLGGTIADFRERERMTTTRAVNKLWLAWLYRDLANEPAWTKKRVRHVFGEEPQVGRMEVVLNEEEWNERLWRIKHLIELRPVTFPDGEPRAGDRVSLAADGVCRVLRGAGGEAAASPPALLDERTQWPTRELTRQRTARYHGMQDPFETNVYTPTNISIVK